ncbi:VWA domain-containing protein, partial [Pseudomonadota bacterium]
MSEKIFTFFLSLLLTVSTLTMADDSDIYLGSSGAASGSSGSINPNIMMVIDTSGSMTNKDGQTKTRLERVKEALVNIINNTNNVNMGLMRFHKNGGPVLYPVSDIDGIAASNDNKVVVSINDDNDDAEEGAVGSTSAGVVIASTGSEAEQLELINTPTLGTTPEAGVVPTTISSGLYLSTNHTSAVNDTSEAADGSIDCSSTSYDLKGDSAVYVRNKFFDVPIPAKANIIHAEIAFTIATDETGDLDVIVRGEDTADAGLLDCSPAVANAISSLPTTTASVAWDNLVHPPGGEQLVSPNLATIIQEIVGTEGTPTSWAIGNDLALIFQGNNGAGKRTVSSEQGSSRPVLKVIFSDGITVTQTEISIANGNDDGEQRSGDTTNNYVTSTDLELVTEGGTDDQRVGIRFQNINVPQGANIHYADLVFEVDEERGTGDVSVEITAEEADDATDNFSAGNPLIGDRSRIQDATGSVDLTIPWQYLTAPDQNDNLYSADISSLVQQIVNRGTTTGPSGSWVANNAMTFFLEEGSFNNGSEFRELEAYNGEAGAAPKLRIWYSEPTLVPGQDQLIGLRFQNVALPKGVEITSAKLEFRAAGGSSADTWMNIFAELPTDGDADAYSETTDNISSRDYSSAYVNWSGPDTVEDDPIDQWVTGDTYQSPDIKDLVQLIVNENDWCGGNALAFK